MTGTQIHRLTAMAAGLLFGSALGSAQVVSWGSPATTAPVGTFRAVAAGSAHVLGLNMDGTITAWGSNSNSQTTVPTGLANVAAVAAGSADSLALLVNGTVIQWGDTTQGEGSVPANLTGVIAIAAGSSHILALEDNGTVVQWGSTSQNQGSVPTDLTGVVAIAAGGNFSLALKSDGTVVQWGDTSQNQGPPPAGLTGVIAIAAGYAHSVALESDGTIVEWGDTSWNQGPPPAGLTGVIAIAAGSYHTLALQSNGTVVQWGDTSRGQGSVPSTLTNLVAIAAGGNFSLALERQTQGIGWGYNGDGELNVPAGPFKVLAGGQHDTVGLKSDGTVTAWGNVIGGELVIPSGLTNVKAIAAGLDYNLALRSDGTVVQWGDTSQGQGGMPDGLNGVIAVASSSVSKQTLALQSDGTVVAWGVLVSGGAYVPPGLANVKAIAAGDHGSLALLSDGTVVEFEDQGDQLPTGLTGVVAIAAGSAEYLALKSDGTVVAWGTNGGGDTVVPSGLANVIGISAGNLDNLALKSDGTAVVWGAAVDGVTNVPANLNNVVGITAGYDFSLALTTSPAVTIGSTPSGLSFTVSGADCVPGSYTTPQVLNWAIGISCTVAFDNPQTGPAGTQYVFNAWTDGIGGASRTIVAPAAATTYTANFTTQYQLTTIISPAGAGTVSSDATFYDANSNATVTATANAGYQFLNWTGPVAQNNLNPTTVPMSGPQTVTANFLFVPTIMVAPVSGTTGAVVTLTATIGSIGVPFAGNVQFRLGTATVGSPVPVTGAGIYTTSYTITQGAGQYTIQATLTSTTGGVNGNSSVGTLTVLQSQTIAFNQSNAQVVGATVPLSATASSHLPVSFTSSTIGVCTVSGTTANMVSAGTCTITASQAGDNITYAAATPVVQSFTVSLQSQTINFPQIGGQVVGASVPLVATASSGLTVTFTSASTNICTVMGTTAKMVSAGSCTITAIQSGNGTYAFAQLSQAFTVSLQSQTINFPQIGGQVVGASVPLVATASSGLTVTFSSSSTSVCTVSGTTAKMVAAGNCMITATQLGNGTYAPASASITFTVAKQSQTISFPTIPAQAVGASIALSATASSGLAVTFSSSPTSVCTVSGTTAKMVAAGTCTLTATQVGNGTYASVQVSQPVTVSAPAANFTITPIPGSETISRGVLAGFILELQSVNKFNGNVTLKCSGGPTGAVCADLPQTFKVNGIALAVSGILFPANTKAGTYTMTFTGVSGSLTNSTTATFTIK